MNVLYLIGNGFGLSYGMKTRYTDFYNEFVKSALNDSEDLKKLKENIRSDYSNWSDLEKALGEYTVNYNSGNLLEETFYSLKDGLQEYLESVDKSFSPGPKTIERARTSIKNPELFLEEADLIPFQDFEKTFSKHGFANTRTVDVVTFNYTTSFEKLIGVSLPHQLSPNCSIRQIRHLHGNINSTILMGVNDSSQISNSIFRSNEDLMEILVKPEANDAMRNLTNTRVANLIKKANVIVLYGLSLGETDQKWWDLIGEQFNRDTFRLVYFYYAPNLISPRRRELTRRVYRECISEIISKFRIPVELQPQVNDKSFIAINKSLFGKSGVE